MAGVRSTPRKGGVYQGWFVDTHGKRKFFTGTTRKRETLEMAQRLEDEHRQVRLGYRPEPNPSDKHRQRPFTDVMDEYLAGGAAQGGRGGRPWGKTHQRNRRTHLAWWQDRLQLEILKDLLGCLPRLERALRDLEVKGCAGKTRANYAEAIASFCDWCVKREYLACDPLKSLGKFDTAPRSLRRSMPAEEINRLLNTCVTDRRLLLETAFVSGLRANELRSLTVHDLDVQRCGLQLDADWTKNRKDGFQPLPASLVERLLAFGRSGEPKRWYERSYRRKDAATVIPSNPLLYVPSHPARELDKDLAAAGIEKKTREGKVDFHAIRKAYINLVIESGVTVKEAQVLARHATPQLTMNVYGHAREERLAEAVERVGQTIMPEEKCVTCVSQEDGTERQGREVHLKNHELTRPKIWWRRRESNPRPKTVSARPLHV